LFERTWFGDLASTGSSTLVVARALCCVCTGVSWSGYRAAPLLETGTNAGAGSLTVIASVDGASSVSIGGRLVRPTCFFHLIALSFP